MGGTLCRLVDHGHEVHIAYQVSGSTAVSDESLWRLIQFAADTGLAGGPSAEKARSLCAAFAGAGALPPSAELLQWKGLLRRHEALAAARVCGVSANRLHFLDLPFYQTGTARNRRLGETDIKIVRELLGSLRPHLIFAAGDLDDPHGTHRICLHALHAAMAQSTAEPWFAQTELWLYRGAWAEWELDEIDMAVPLSPHEVLRRRRAIFRHETQKDQALFLGDDHREFWQRTENRSQRLAEAYNALGLAEYEAIEAFKRYSPEEFLRDVEL